MTEPAQAVVQALVDLIDRARLQGEACLIGGQALRDWHAREVHILERRPGIPAPRTTTGIDLHLALAKGRDRIVPILESDWRQDTEQSFRFHWRHDATVTLDLIEQTNPAAQSRIKFIARLSTGSGQVSAVRVLPPWIATCALWEPCFAPAFARLGLLRLTHLGLLASKLAAVATTAEAIRTAKADPSAVPEWCARLPKDLQDLRLLLDRAWRARLWLMPDRERRTQAQRDFAQQVEELVQWRDRPPLFGVADWSDFMVILPVVKQILDEMAQGDRL